MCLSLFKIQKLDAIQLKEDYNQFGGPMRVKTNLTGFFYSFKFDELKFSIFLQPF